VVEGTPAALMGLAMAAAAMGSAVAVAALVTAGVVTMAAEATLAATVAEEATVEGLATVVAAAGPCTDPVHVGKSARHSIGRATKSCPDGTGTMTARSTRTTTRRRSIDARWATAVR